MVWDWRQTRIRYAETAIRSRETVYRVICKRVNVESRGNSGNIFYVETENFIWRSATKINNIGGMGTDYIYYLENEVEDLDFIKTVRVPS